MADFPELLLTSTPIKGKRKRVQLEELSTAPLSQLIQWIPPISPASLKFHRTMWGRVCVCLSPVSSTTYSFTKTVFMWPPIRKYPFALRLALYWYFYYCSICITTFRNYAIHVTVLHLPFFAISSAPPLYESRKYMVFEENLLQLLRNCPTCMRPCQIDTFEIGTLLSVKQVCIVCMYAQKVKSSSLLAHT